VWKTTDGGATWVKKTSESANCVGLYCSNGDIYFPAIWNNGMFRSTDAGETWTRTSGYGTVQGSVVPAELPDGRIVSSSLRYYGLVVSTDGSDWQDIGPRGPGRINAIAYNPTRKEFFVSCREVGDLGVYTLAYDWETAVVRPDRISHPAFRAGLPIKALAAYDLRGRRAEPGAPGVLIAIDPRGMIRKSLGAMSTAVAGGR
jgi:hypothetical protein